MISYNQNRFARVIHEFFEVSSWNQNVCKSLEKFTHIIFYKYNANYEPKGYNMVLFYDIG